MYKKLIFLTSFVLLLAVGETAFADTYPGVYMELKVDLCYNLGTDEQGNFIPDPETFKGSDPGEEDWIPWAWWSDDQPHDAQNIEDIGGSGISIGIGMGRGDSYLKHKLWQPVDEAEKLCNSFLVGKYETGDDAGPIQGNANIVLWGDPELPPGEYWIWAYHNYQGVDPNDPNFVIPEVNVVTYTWSTTDVNHQDYACRCPNDTGMQNIDAELETLCPDNGGDCIGVDQIPQGEPYDINVPLQKETLDANLVPSFAKFISDGSTAKITYWAQTQPKGTAALNAFILWAPKPHYAWGPVPRPNQLNGCPDTDLNWKEGAYAENHDVYFGTDFNDVNDATTAYNPNNVYKGRQPVEDVNYDPTPGDSLLDFETTYYWRIDEVNDACSPFLWKAKVWSFTTEDGKAREPDPVDGQFSVLADAVLAWTPSCLANYHDVYFSTDFDDVNEGTDPNSGAGQGRIEGDNFDPDGLQENTRYYWRLDEVGDTTFVRGDVWTFMTIGGTLFHFEFDGPLDANIHDPCDEDRVTDSTGNVTFEIRGPRRLLTYGEPNPLWNPLGTSAEFAPGDDDDDDDVGLYRGEWSTPRVRGVDITDLTAPEYTIEMWIKPDDLGDTMTLFRKYKRSYVVDVNDNRTIRFSQAGCEPISSDPNDPLMEGLWYHIAAVFDSNDPCESLKLYIDSIQVAGANTTTATNPTNDDDPVGIGMTIVPAWDTPKGYEVEQDAFDGLIDELRVSDIALGPAQFLFRGDRGIAWYPKPRDQSTGVHSDVVLIWKPGDLAGSHDVYFGTSYDDVNDGTGGTAKPNQEPNEYNPGPLALDTTFYWRIDEVDDSNGYKWTGSVWRFTTAKYLVVDDFEPYCTGLGCDNDILDTWLDGLIWPPINNSGSEVVLGIDPYEPVHRGKQSMKYLYDNCDSWGWDLDYYSEVEVAIADLPIGPDWTFSDVKALILYFYGDPNNDANEQMYVGLEDTSAAGHYTQADYGDYGEDMNDIRVDEWHEWIIPLIDFSDGGVVLTAVDKIYLGFGVRGNTSVPGGSGMVFFDDIRVSRPICVPYRGPRADLSGDCLVDLADVVVVAEDWLDADMILDVSNPGTGADLVGWWKLDEGDSDVANDSSIYANHGTVEGDYLWVADHNEASNGFALRFRNDGGKVRVPDAPILRPSAQVTAAAWVNYSEPWSYSARVVVKGADENDSESYALQLDGDRASFFIRSEPNGDNLGVEGAEGEVDPDEWVHLAGTYDGNTVKCYVNGRLSDSEDVNTVTILSDTNDLCIGNQADANDRALIGKVDDARVYNRALLETEVAWLATDGTGLYLMQSPANLYDEEDPGERAVNFRDYAELINDWGMEKLWPE